MIKEFRLKYTASPGGEREIVAAEPACWVNDIPDILTVVSGLIKATEKTPLVQAKMLDLIQQGLESQKEKMLSAKLERKANNDNQH